MSARTLSTLACLEAVSIVVHAADGRELGRVTLTRGPESLYMAPDAALVASASALGVDRASLREYVAATVGDAGLELSRAARGLASHPSRGAPN